ncbi:DUF5662 family protein [Pendulispora rubella]|uniref:DUF5662 family protein n=1 Tax=Pendulispora rubella TaxID=2741070 RepID=A0ABZ2LIV0_9BACT
MPTEAMVARFEARTRMHIGLVAKNLLLLQGYMGLERSELEARARVHDQSKFDDSERTGYIWLTWRYDSKAVFEYPEGIQTTVEQALRHHRMRNLHHPEAHATPDAMGILDLVEMVCDWTAIAQELHAGAGSARSWAEDNLGKWPFSPGKRHFVLATIDELDRRHAR